MASKIGQRTRWCWLCLSIALSPSAFAAVPVEESAAQDSALEVQPPQPTTKPPSDAPPPASGVQVYGISQGPAAPPARPPALPSSPRPPDVGADSARLGALFHQLQVLQQELRTLRGLVEEQAFQIERLARDQKEQYVDLDGRILSLSGAPVADAAPGERPSGGPGLLRPPTTASGGVGQQPTAGPMPLAAGSEQEAYSQAFNLMRTQQFDAAAAGFQQILRDYPNGRFAPNCYYWLGELHLSAGEHEQARQQFAQVVNLYGDHNKVPDALYKLGDVHQRLGDNERALTHLQRVQRDYPDSSAASLAQSLAAELK